jgi:hypothetical protein
MALIHQRKLQIFGPFNDYRQRNENNFMSLHATQELSYARENLLSNPSLLEKEESLGG